jgi:hypothetical protein
MDDLPTHPTSIELESSSALFSEFLEEVPPNSRTHIADLVAHHSGDTYRVNRPDLQLHCPNESCNGTRFFRNIDDPLYIKKRQLKNTYMQYMCSNCQQHIKTFAVWITIDDACTHSGPFSGDVYKLGEFPVFGPPTPSRLISMIGTDRDLFLRGRRCENQGLGIGAFVYYRRVVESQKNRILDEIIKVARKSNTSKDVIAALEAAKAETQFAKAIEATKSAIPPSLLIEGHNPLKLLHSALSDGVHNRTDEECLQSASSDRVVLAELAERVGMALKNEAELSHAISHLMRDQSKDKK